MGVTGFLHYLAELGYFHCTLANLPSRDNLIMSD